MIDTILKTVITFIISGLLGFIVAELKNLKVFKESLKCLLRANMVNTYFAYKEMGTMPYYCKQSWYLMYESYKGLGGNSFIDDIKKEIDSIDVNN